VNEYHGGCHCGVLQIIYRTGLDPARWPLRHDGCSFCRRHGVVGTSDPLGEVTLKIGDVSKVRRYRFAQRTAEFLICSECGVFVAALTAEDGGTRAVINARVLEGVSLNFNEVKDVHFDDETPAKRSERRGLYWTPVSSD
jgi:hypothetical protein